MTTDADLTELWNYCEETFDERMPNSDHGNDHWRRVEKNALELARESGADRLFVRLFAVLHDSRRENEMDDPDHGQRAADLAKELRGKMFDISDELFDDLIYALINHDRGKRSNDANIGTCWDADRLDLARVRITPLPSFMSTEAGRKACMRILQKTFGSSPED